MKLPLRDAAAASLGIELFLSVVLAGGAGWWADGKFHTAPTFLLVGFVVGVLAGLRSVLRFARRDAVDPKAPPTKP